MNKKIIYPHGKVSRQVEESDLPRIVKIFDEMSEILTGLEVSGMYKHAFALAHSQIEKNDPLRFFVLNQSNQYIKEKVRQFISSFIVINPVLVGRSNTVNDDYEGCLSFPDGRMRKVDRYSKVTIAYQVPVLVDNKIALQDRKSEFAGRIGRIFQHELDHLEAVYIFPYEIKD